jgi:F420-dependent oxidoreductase-like protein
MALAGRATKTIELGTSVLQTYTSHPVLQVNRAASTAAAMGRPGLTLGIGPSHQPVIEGMFGVSYEHPGAHTEEYTKILTTLLRGEGIDFVGDHITARIPAVATPQQPVSVMVSALAPRLLRVAGELTDGTILWMANAKSIDVHVAPRINKAASNAGRPAPRIVAGLPVAVHDNVDEARDAAAKQFAGYGVLPNYRRILDIGGAPGPADAAICGDEASVTAQIQGLFDAGATDVWAAVFPVGEDKSGSRKRTRALLKELANA